MYAVIKAGGKQHRVQPGDVIEVELLHGQHGTSVSFIPLLVVDDEGKTHFGKDLGKAQVKAKLLGEEKGDKVKIFKYRPKTGYAKRQGHRQMHSLVQIEDVVFGKRTAGTKSEGEKPEVEAAPPPHEDSVGDSASAGVAADTEAAEAPEKKPRPRRRAEVEGAAPKPSRPSGGTRSGRTTKGRS
jgi:large subunit ribosomal protein L21